MKVEQLMTRIAPTCRADDSLNAPARLMWDQALSFVVVVEDQKPIGVVTERDVAMGAYTRGRPLWEIPVRDAMASKPLVVRSDASIDFAEKLMQENQIRRLPVTESSGKFIGMISLSDIAREATRQRGKKTFDVTQEGVINTLAAFRELGGMEPSAIA
jgi:CBS domain-containing protein